MLERKRSYYQIDMEFHTYIAGCSRNLVINDIVPSIHRTILLQENMSVRKYGRSTVEGHWRIYKAIEEHKSLEAYQAHPYAVNIVGIESPGLTSALPIARRAISRIARIEKLEKNEKFDPVRRAVKFFSEMDLAEQRKQIEENPNYGEIICRCENISEADIIRAIHNPLGVHTVEAIKNRTRATMGRCQGGYCETRIVQLLESEFGLRPED